MKNIRVGLQETQGLEEIVMPMNQNENERRRRVEGEHPAVRPQNARHVPSTPRAQGQPEEHLAGNPSRRAKRKKPRKKYRVARALLITAVLVGLCCFLAYFGLQSVSDLLGLNLEVIGIEQEDREVKVDIPEGSSTREIANILKKAGVVDTPLTFQLYSKFKDADGKYQFGEYIFNCNMAYDEIIIALKSGNERQDVVRISFPEGLTLWEIGQKLEDADVCSAEAFVKELQTGTFDYEFMKSIPADNPLRFYKYEGYVFPNTYDFFVGEKPSSVVKKFFDSFNANITGEMYDRMEEMGMTLDETITLASIIQKEASYPEDMYAVSGVFHNRFENAEVYPQMQSDVTIFYVEKSIKPHIDTKNQEMYDAYNTYKCEGLPVGPICNPGIDAIKAALYPDQNDYYYFLTDQNGDFYYAATMQEHEQNIRTADGVAGGIATD